MLPWDVYNQCYGGVLAQFSFIQQTFTEYPLFEVMGTSVRKS